MKNVFYISVFLFPALIWAQENRKSTHSSDPGAVNTQNSEKKTVDEKKKKSIVFTEKPERVIIDSLTGKEVRISLEQPSTVPPKH
ncbi:MAG: hypothetical protein IT233_13000 [Bacteroidia bacterium]|nr:hypothetical protein [Bacteroidia bacterium]